MKKLIMFLMAIFFVVSADAQWKVGRVVKTFYIHDVENDYDQEVVQGEYRAYSENKDGSYSIYGQGYEGIPLHYGEISKTTFQNHLQFTGFYFGEVTDPRDDYVNVRKSPGTNYSVAGKLRADNGTTVYFKKTDNNWVKVYVSYTEKYEGFFWGNDLSDDMNHYNELKFVGYVYKDRIITPTEYQ